MGAPLFREKRNMQAGKDAEPLRPDELMRLRKLLRVQVLGDYLDSAVIAKRLSLCKRTILDLANAGAFDGNWGVAFKPSPNRLKVPLAGVDAYIRAHPASFCADACTRLQGGSAE